MSTTSFPAPVGSVAPVAPVAPDAARMTFERMAERVRYDGAYATRERAEEVIHTVLAALGRRLGGDERVELAAVLPVEAARTFSAQIPETTRLTGWEFVKDIADRTGGTPATTRWDVGTVLGLLARMAGNGLVTRVLAQLPPGYALLFGRPELLQAA